ncbi:hypothetical protein SPF06_04015 [Sinomonas sp. JGH33]|uniref:Uncharacterized protein n=1 Tax=Sinomonas terricola TaxID=3110330 RepID=A0ABU5T2K8_9MICC|nr:hypothetical protein [Sinomonas sp. JGH33]MEA5453880.1 hypothetical protein [Sinomonas sp. JGH33]
MFTLNRRTILRSTGIAGLASITAGLFPELSPLAAFAKAPSTAPARPWYAEAGSAREARAGELEKASADYLPRLGVLASSGAFQFPSGGKIDQQHAAKMAVHTMQDGTSVSAWSKPLDDSHVVVIYSEEDAKGRTGRSQVFVWEVDAVLKAGRVAAKGPALKSLTKASAPAGGGLAAAHAIDCGPGTYVCSYCVGFDAGFVDCCGPCGFAFLGGLVSGLSCVLIWCNWCVWEHCTQFADSCCSA